MQDLFFMAILSPFRVAGRGFLFTGKIVITKSLVVLADEFNYGQGQLLTNAFISIYLNAFCS
jgi:hypothetical protein